MKKSSQIPIDPRLWLLISPALPVGGYSYSHGLEHAVAAGWVSNLSDARDWITGLARDVLPRLDLPVLAKIYRCAEGDDAPGIVRWNAVLLASRESAELQREDAEMGEALKRLLTDLVRGDAIEILPEKSAFATSFAVACLQWGIDVADACAGYAWVWCENQVAAAVKLVPLGQTDGQKILLEMVQQVHELAELALAVSDDDVGMTCPALAIASAAHETQYSRQFRS
ncbi:MAG: urease accessory protein UreF [Pseudomonadales bacterium]|jgi:urease accessory protein